MHTTSAHTLARSEFQSAVEAMCLGMFLGKSKSVNLLAAGLPCSENVETAFRTGLAQRNAVPRLPPWRATDLFINMSAWDGTVNAAALMAKSAMDNRYRTSARKLRHT
jgi:hypothetical protein